MWTIQLCIKINKKSVIVVLKIVYTGYVSPSASKLALKRLAKNWIDSITTPAIRISKKISWVPKLWSNSRMYGFQ